MIRFNSPPPSSPDGVALLTRRNALAGVTAAAAVLLSERAACAAVRGPVLAPPEEAKLVRLSSVVTPLDGGLYDALLPDFTRETGYRVALTTSEAVFAPARSGKADIVLSHYGHTDLKAFMEDELGEWPQAAFFNLLALIGPASDPARVAGSSDLVEAFRRLAAARVPFVVNDADGVKYLSNVLWEAVGRPAKEGWYLDEQARGPGAIALAAEKGGYTIWGLTPFLRMQRAGRPGSLAPLVFGDPLTQRIMVTIAVRGDKLAGINVAGAKAFQDYLIAPRTQALIHNFRLAGIDRQIWYPAGRNNAGDVLGVN
ncbi:MAG: hypothetical protein U1E56_08390 [Bauldia sp.]